MIYGSVIETLNSNVPIVEGKWELEDDKCLIKLGKLKRSVFLFSHSIFPVSSSEPSGAMLRLLTIESQRIPAKANELSPKQLVLPPQGRDENLLCPPSQPTSQDNLKKVFGR